VQYIFRERDIYMPFIPAYCYNSVLLLVIVINLLLYLIYKLNFIYYFFWQYWGLNSGFLAC
jgi:hypothetical protein